MRAEITKPASSSGEGLGKGPGLAAQRSEGIPPQPSSIENRRIGLLTASASRAGCGVFEAVVAQAEILRTLGAQPLIFALHDEHSATDRSRFAPSPAHVHPITGPAAFGYAPTLFANLLAAKLDCLHLHGIWMYPSHAGAKWARQTGRPYLISPHGMLDPWIIARGRWKKALARIGYERAGWQAACAFHALTASEAADIHHESGRTDTIVIPNAGPIVAPPDTSPRARHVAYIGRIHPKQNLAALVAAWRQAELPADARLTIAGWGEPQDVAALRMAIGEAAGTIDFVGPLYGAAKQALLARARFAILPSLSEGLPMAVLEGWAAGAPSIMTAACHLPEGPAAGAALICDPDAGSIAQALTRALQSSEPEWQAMARAARALAAGPFRGQTVAAHWAAAYDTLMAGAGRGER